MTAAIPYADLSRFTAIPPRLIILAYLRSSKTGLSNKVLARNLASVMPAGLLQTTLETIRNEGLMTSAAQVELNDAGRKAADKDLGRDAGKSWEIISSRRLPLMVLGLDPDGAAGASTEALKARAIAVGFGLADHKSPMTKKLVCSILVWQVLKAAIPSIFEGGSFPLIDRFGPIEKTLLAKLANTRAKTIDQIFTALVATAIQSKKTDPDSFRKGLISAGLKTQRNANQSTPRDKSSIDALFASRVKSVAGELSTPPFRGRVSISQVYDAYGRFHSDAGSLAAFKSRLVEAALARSLELGRLDLPEAMDEEQRLRSEARWGDNVVHFVITARE